jgi:hypothetical protein
MRLPASLAAAATSVVLAVSGVALLPASASSAAAPPAMSAASAAPAAAGSSRSNLSPGLERASADLAKGRTLRVIATFKAAGGIGKRPDVAAIRSARDEVLAGLPRGGYDVVASYSRIPAVSLEVDGAALGALAEDPEVLSVQEDHVVETTMLEANALTGADDVHDMGITGDGLTAAIIDTGVDSAGGVVHSGLADDLAGQACFRTENDCIGGAGSAEDQHGHGTHVAGMITGPHGVAPDTRFYALKVFTTGDTSDTNILNALNHVIGLNNATPGTVDLVNMSLGGDNFNTQASCDANNAAYATAFATLNSQSVTIFASTGNDADTNGVGAPGCVTGAVGVGSTGDNTFTLSFSNCTDNGAPDKVSCFSNTTPVQGAGELVDLVAPGCLITSLGLDNATNANLCGTSMATPYALGVGALAQEYAKDHAGKLSPTALENLLEDTGKPITDYRLTGGPAYPRVAPLDVIGSLALPAPTSLQVTGTTPTSVSLSWGASAGADHYRLTRTDTTSGTTTNIPTVGTGTTFTDSTAPCGELSYLVRAADAEGVTSGPSNTVTTTARPCPTTPTDVAITKVDADTHDVSWQLPSPSSSVVLQRRLPGGSFVDYQNLAGNATGYQDTVAGCGHVEYRVFAAAANGDRSAPSASVRRALCAPANDDLADAEVVTVGSVGATVTDTEPNAKYGSQEPGDPVYSCHFGGAAKGFDGVWYKITPPSDSRVTVSTATSTITDPEAGAPDTLVAIYKGTPSLANEVACNDDISGSNLRSTATSNLLTGNTYWVHVSQWTDVPDSATGNLVTTFTWAAPIFPPANDDFADAATITAPAYTLNVTNAQNATVQATDPTHPAACVFGNTAKVGNHTLWWKFTPEVGGKLDLDTLGSGGSFTDTLLSVYTGAPGSFTNVACNDDANAGANQLRSQLVDVPVSGGTTYYVMASRWSATPTATTGNLALATSFEASPGVTLSKTAVAVEEGRPGATYTARLNTQPSADVVVNANGNADCSVSPALTFTSANWATPQTFTVTAVDDGLTEPEETCTITHGAMSTDGVYNGIAIGSVMGTVTDKLVTSITLTTPAEGQLVVKDAGVEADFACSDNRAGAGIASCVGTVADGAPIDTATLGEHEFTVTLTDVHGGTTTETNTYTVTEAPALVLSKSSVAVEEGRPGDTYTAELSTAPLADVTVTPTGDADCSVGPATLTFTPADWDTAQTVTVTAVDDGSDEATEACTVTHALASTDDRFDALPAPSVTGTVTDKLVTSVSLTTPAEGASYVQGAVVNADFACTDNRSGAGIASCVGTVADGSAIDTSTVGPHEFTVTLTDVHGGTATETNTYTVTSGPAATTGKPDARITQPAPAVGDNVYGGTKQKKKVKAAAGKKVTYVVSLQNDGTGADRLKVLGAKSAKGFKVKYVGPDGKNITKAVVAGTFLTPTLAKNATYDIKVVVKVTKKAEKKLKVSVKATSVATAAASDVVFMLTKRL